MRLLQQLLFLMMNCENLSALGRIQPPSINCDGVSPIDSFAVNLYGDVALLDKDGKVSFSTIRDNSDKRVQDVPVDKIDELLSCKFTNIEFNGDGTILLLWSSKVMTNRAPYEPAHYLILLQCFLASQKKDGLLEFLT